jgi:hypothetical protein
LKISGLDRLFLLLGVILSSYQVAIGTDGLGALPTFAYTIAFGVLLVAGLLLIILGLDVLDSPTVVIVSSVIPLSLSLGLVWEHIPTYQTAYLLFAVTGMTAIIITRYVPMPGKLPVVVLAVVHAVAGMVIFLLPISAALSGEANPGFAFVGLGGAFIGLGGLLLSFLKTGRPILPRETIMKVFPGLLFLMTAAFVAGFSYT